MLHATLGRSVPAAVALLAVLATSACGPNEVSPPSPFTGSDAAAGDEGVRDPDEIQRSEIVRRGRMHHTAMELVRRLRPAWLRARGQKSFTDESTTYPLVYIDEVRHGALSTLHGIPAAEIHSMEFFSTADATTRWGTGHPSGVINVVTGR